MPAPQTPRPSASVILLRDGGGDLTNPLEVLLVRRNEAIAAHGGSWVFPGGKVEADDAGADGLDHITSAQRAAVREVWEETGITLTQARLQTFSHWTTPVIRPKRFANWFFVAPVDAETEVRVDGSEIIDSRWMSVESAFEARRQGEIVLPPPTFVTLQTLRRLERLAGLPAFFEQHRIERYNPKIIKLPDGELALYEGDAGYDTLAHEIAGPRHRLHMLPAAWHYERTSPQEPNETLS